MTSAEYRHKRNKLKPLSISDLALLSLTFASAVFRLQIWRFSYEKTLEICFRPLMTLTAMNMGKVQEPHPYLLSYPYFQSGKTTGCSSSIHVHP